MHPNNAHHWVSQLFTWLDEEIFTCGLDASRSRTDQSGESYVIVEPYGWRSSDAVRHEHLRSAAGPLGWYGEIYTDQLPKEVNGRTFRPPAHTGVPGCGDAIGTDD